MNIRERVRTAYSKTATNPSGEHAFPCGNDFALSLGYPEELLRRFPREAKESFAGVSSVSLVAEIPFGSTVLDLGCGAGLDALIAAEKTGSKGRVLGFDFSRSMVEKARRAASLIEMRHVEFFLGDGERLPIQSRSVDVALVNGIFNLNPQREEIFPELARILKKEARLYGAELILKEPLSEAERSGESNWFA